MGRIKRKEPFIPKGFLNLPLVGTVCLLFVISGFIVSFINCERCGRLVYIFQKGHLGQQVERTLKVILYLCQSLHCVRITVASV